MAKTTGTLPGPTLPAPAPTTNRMSIKEIM
jgi:hypothetical protein